MTAETSDPRYAHLEDPTEREWLTNVPAADVLRNAHRFYDFMRESGVPADSYTRELAFQKAAAAQRIPYDVLYDAWLSETPVRSELPGPGTVPGWDANQRVPAIFTGIPHRFIPKAAGFEGGPTYCIGPCHGHRDEPYHIHAD
jgi:hypothetical protein